MGAQLDDLGPFVQQLCFEHPIGHGQPHLLSLPGHERASFSSVQVAAFAAELNDPLAQGRGGTQQPGKGVWPMFTDEAVRVVLWWQKQKTNLPGVFDLR